MTAVGPPDWPITAFPEGRSDTAATLLCWERRTMAKRASTGKASKGTPRRMALSVCFHCVRRLVRDGPAAFLTTTARRGWCAVWRNLVVSAILEDRGGRPTARHMRISSEALAHQKCAHAPSLTRMLIADVHTAPGPASIPDCLSGTYVPAPGGESYWPRREFRHRPSATVRVKPAGAAPIPHSRRLMNAPLSGQGSCSVTQSRRRRIREGLATRRHARPCAGHPRFCALAARSRHEWPGQARP